MPNNRESGPWGAWCNMSSDVGRREPSSSCYYLASSCLRKLIGDQCAARANEDPSRALRDESNLMTIVDRPRDEPQAVSVTFCTLRVNKRR